MTQSRETIDRAFAEIVAAAVEGRRCPINDTGAVTSHTTIALAKERRIRILISSKNWRTVEILAGEHAGKSTARDPAGRGPWKVIDDRGTRVNGKLLVPASPPSRRPSPPRLLTPKDIEES